MMLQNIKLLYIGSLNKRSNSYRRFSTISRLCFADKINTDPFLSIRFFSGIQHHFNIGPGILLLNKKIRQAIKEKEYDVVFVDNKPYLLKNTLCLIKKKLPAIKIINLLTDDPFGRYTKSWGLLKKTAFMYDEIFVQREINIPELKAVGAKKVSLCYRSFDPQYNKPVTLEGKDDDIYSTSVGFVGTYERERASFIAYLIEEGITVSVTGNDWPGKEYWDIIQPFYKGPSVYGDAYIKTLNGMKICLHFLRHGNRDEQDSRTFEIPACGVFMLAERSELHLRLFKDNEEAVFFDTKAELLEKVKYYLEQSEQRERIAINGYRKCFSGGYTHEARMVKVLEQIFE